MRACLATTGVTSATDEVFQRQKSMFHPRLADLFEALGVIGAAAHAIQILRNERVIGLRQREPIDWLIAIVTRICSYCQTNLRRVVSLLVYVFDVSNNHIRARH